MAGTLIATSGDPTSNSYLTLAEAEAYFALRLNSTNWDNATADTRTKALIMACQKIETCKFHGSPQTTTQKLAWPRVPPSSDPYMLGIPWLTSYEDVYKSWYVNGIPTIPEKVKFAQCEEALFLLTNQQGIDKRAAIRDQGMSSISIEGLSETYTGITRIAEAALAFLNSVGAVDNGVRIARQ